MSLKVTLEEEPRVFLVRIGCNDIGKVTSHACTDDDKDEESYYGELFTADPDKRDQSVGWFKTLKAAALAVVEEEHGEAKIDSTTERIV